LTENVANGWICGPDSDQDASSFAREPVAEDAKVHGPGERLNGTIHCFDDEEVGCTLVFDRDKLKAAKSDLSDSNYRVHKADQLPFAVNVTQVRQKEASQRICEQKCGVHVRDCVFRPVIQGKKVFSG